MNDSNKTSDKILMIRDEYQQLSDFFRQQYSPNNGLQKLSTRLALIKNTFFYETLAQFGPDVRLDQFKSSIKTGDRFVAKVTKVYEKQADVVLIWSEKRDISDLNIKATLLLFHRNSRHNEFEVEKLDIIFVEIIDFESSSSSIKVIQCRALNKKDDHSAADEDEGLILESKYRPCSSKIGFGRYMKEHNDLNNPSIIKLPFVSLLYRQQFQKSHLKRLEEKAKEKEEKERQEKEKAEKERAERELALRSLEGDRRHEYSTKKYQNSKVERSHSRYSDSHRDLDNSSHNSHKSKDKAKERKRTRKYSSDESVSSDTDAGHRKSKKRKSSSKHKHKSRSKRKRSRERSRSSKHKSATKEHRHYNSSSKHR